MDSKVNLNSKEDFFRYLEFLWDQAKQSRSVSDLWFRYSILVTGLPIGILIGVPKLIGTINSDYLILIGTASGFILTIVGILFMLIYTRLRINNLILYKKISFIENKYL